MSPDAPSPSSRVDEFDAALIRARLEDAQPTRSSLKEDPEGAERRRVEAIKWLLDFRRVQIEEAWRIHVEEGQPFRPDVAVDPDVGIFFARMANHIWTASDPLATLTQILSVRKRKGRPPEDATKNFMTVAMVLKRVCRRKSAEEASQNYAATPGATTTADYARKLYFDLKDTREFRAFQAEVAMKADYVHGKRRADIRKARAAFRDRDA